LEEKHRQETIEAAAPVKTTLGRGERGAANEHRQ
jgi:hypothetical protein